MLLARLHGDRAERVLLLRLLWEPGHCRRLSFVWFFFLLFFFPSLRTPSPSLSSSRLVSLQTSGEKKRSGHAASNGFAGHINLPDLVQQSHSPAGTPTEALGRVSTHAQDMDSVPEVGGGGLLFLLCIAFQSSINISAPSRGSPAFLPWLSWLFPLSVSGPRG